MTVPDNPGCPELCRTCDGTGMDPLGDRPCLDCGGRGTTPEQDEP